MNRFFSNRHIQQNINIWVHVCRTCGQIQLQSFVYIHIVCVNRHRIPRGIATREVYEYDTMFSHFTLMWNSGTYTLINTTDLRVFFLDEFGCVCIFGQPAGRNLFVVVVVVVVVSLCLIKTFFRFIQLPSDVFPYLLSSHFSATLTQIFIFIVVISLVCLTFVSPIHPYIYNIYLSVVIIQRICIGRI